MDIEVEYTNSVTGKKIKMLVNDKKQLFEIKNETFIFGGGLVFQQEATSELEIFNEYNKNDFGGFVMGRDNEGSLMVGEGSGGLFGGLDKQLTFKALT